MNVVEKYNPANAATVSAEDIAGLQNLSKEDIAALAEAYPNTAHSNNYLLLYDKRLAADKQLFQLSSWKNLKDLHDLQQNHFVAFGFRGGATYQQPPASTPAAPATKATVDLSEQEASNAEGLKQTVEASEVSNGLNAGLRNINVSTDETLHGEILAPQANTVETPVVNPPLVNAPADTTVANNELIALESYLAELVKDGAHHMKIKAVEKQIADLKGNV